MKLERWPVGIACFFLGIVGLNTYLMTLAARGYQGVLEDRPYTKGLQYETEKAQLEAFLDSRWQAILRSSPFDLRLLDDSGTPVRGARVTVRALRPNSAAQDQNIELSERTEGLYESTILLAPGRWLLKLAIEHAGRTYRISQDVYIEKGAAIVLADQYRKPADLRPETTR